MKDVEDIGHDCTGGKAPCLEVLHAVSQWTGEDQRGRKGKESVEQDKGGHFDCLCDGLLCCFGMEAGKQENLV